MSFDQRHSSLSSWKQEEAGRLPLQPNRFRLSQLLLPRLVQFSDDLFRLLQRHTHTSVDLSARPGAIFREVEAAYQQHLRRLLLADVLCCLGIFFVLDHMVHRGVTGWQRRHSVRGAKGQNSSGMRKEEEEQRAKRKSSTGSRSNALSSYLISL